MPPVAELVAVPALPGPAVPVAPGEGTAGNCGTSPETAPLAAPEGVPCADGAALVAAGVDTADGLTLLGLTLLGLTLLGLTLLGAVTPEPALEADEA
jgi:hypothetical protein